MENICIICNETVSETTSTVKLTIKGSEGVNQASAKLGDSIETLPGQVVHTFCRKTYCNPKRISQHIKSLEEPKKNIAAKRSLRSETHAFNFATDCLFCGETEKKFWRTKKSNVIPVINGNKFQDSIRSDCKKRGDSWADEVFARIEYARDCHAADAVYHPGCRVSFSTGRKNPTSSGESHIRKPRKEDDIKHGAFQRLTEYIESVDDEDLTLSGLIKHMEKLLEGTGMSPYEPKYLRNKLEKYFGDSINFTIISHQITHVTLKPTTTAILKEFYKHHRKEDNEYEKSRILETAAKLIRSDILSMDSNKAFYPSGKDLASLEQNLEFLPLSLRSLLEALFTSKNAQVKISSIGQAVVQATRPRHLIAPLQIGLGVQVHHHVASRFLVDTLHTLGFCCPYREVLRYESSAAVSNTDFFPNKEDIANRFMQFIADNVDHNIATIDGHGTFHGMGIVAAVTPQFESRRRIQRLTSSLEGVKSSGNVRLRCFLRHQELEIRGNFENLPKLDYTDTSPVNHIHLVWKLSWSFDRKRPSWNGAMQAIVKGDHAGPSSVVFLPIIDMNPSDETCIYSTLHFVCDQAKKFEKNPILTFDQPLWWKATQIISSEPKGSPVKSIILRLGPFHMQMSFLGCIGHIMRGSGLQDVLEQVFAPNSVSHMLSGKAVSRAVRGHILVCSALHAILTNKTVIPSLDDPSCQDQIDTSNFPNPRTGSHDLHSEKSEMQLEDPQPGTSKIPQTSTSDLVKPTEDAGRMSCEKMDIPRVAVLPDDLLDPAQDSCVSDLDIDTTAVESIFDSLVSGEIDHLESHQKDLLKEVSQQLQEQRKRLSTSRTSKLWYMYLDTIDILLAFITAERSGDWGLHLKCVLNMLPFFAATGHNMYAKSAYLYLQNMMGLKDRCPSVYKAFEAGHHSVRRKPRYWAGLSTDLIIEQCLMRSVKTSGGLTRGRGMDETTRSRWLLSMPDCADVNSGMQALTDVSFESGEQHKEAYESRIVKDDQDVRTLLQYIQAKSPFTDDVSLRNIATGETASPGVDVDEADKVGAKILSSMTNKSIDKYVFKKKDQVTTMLSKSSVTIKGKSVEIDPQVLFQRLLIAAETTGETSEEVFRYELCSYPPALFESSSSMRPANKSQLADYLWNMHQTNYTPQKLPRCHFVLDGGWLLQKIPWVRGLKYIEIVSSYSEFLSKQYPQATAVFDGYSKPSTKLSTHNRRKATSNSPSFSFTSDMIFDSKKDQFLQNIRNKEQFITMLSKHLQEAGHETKHAESDADYLIVMTAVDKSKETETTLIGEDTDLLVLLMYHVGETSKDVYFVCPQRRQAKKEARLWNIKHLQNVLGTESCRHILFFHAFLWCDTTSRIYGFGKAETLKKGDKIRDQASVFLNTASSSIIEKAGEETLVKLLGYDKDTLNRIRYIKFCEKVATHRTAVVPRTLPPTSEALRHHSRRVYYQIKVWQGLDEIYKPEDWGWYEDKLGYLPVLTEMPAAPDEILNVVRCNCKTNCVTTKCTCRRHGLLCSDVCKGCRGNTCWNSPRPDNDSLDM